ncbi:bifunctional preprotein translocase subunit SecD/SecF [Mycoplasmopsis californica HAZ160_1]|uniref:Bifunctional preprotein translocase subunit SecD/SecF n=1 Tax=Mycoplasmopsis californica HAZ160_1 TaxID=1397850 RepID=A0AAT9F8B0_9BACT|nr:hypothetical protein [Mycoplasmopsis californica]BAP01139.1 bifunctional preprotein translocase subunit SecD/SecF [Mycoplasmopsis californica HAZ160_1]BBG41005.1 bifunctional preprotein translocase subunit SecD/SecF [Mycoplasmopsis californica]BBG41598.1 bifunctional preprotein translocase subunit SecD/SecF [Mycoplasmopsis californica]BBG42192.1 bifunctional preprotein translocase subunit SecD/SecF [Mycoplasmopsis californica]BBG42774.1 bifunctional preprotein translocase subunit SecD/SecF 
MNKIKRFFQKLFKASTWKNFFTLTTWKRWFLSFFIVTASVSAVAVGTTLYTSKNIKKSVEYGGGQEFLISIDKSQNDQKNYSAEQVARSIQTRINSTSDYNDIRVVAEGNDKIRVSKTGALNFEDRKKFEKLITTKSTLIFTDINGQPLFRNGEFVEPTADNKVNWAEEIKKPDGLKQFVPPVESSKPNFNGFGSGGFIVNVHFKKDAEIQWNHLKNYLNKKIEASPKNTKANVLLTWLNLDTLVSIAQKEYSAEWKKVEGNPYKFVYINEDPNLIRGNGLLKIHSIKAQNFLINQQPISRFQFGDSFTILSDANGQRLSQSDANKLADEISFGTSNYDLRVISSNLIPATPQINYAYILSFIAAGVILVVMILILLINYAFIGLLGSITLSLYTFLSLTLLVGLGGEYSPVALASILIGLAVCFNAIVATFSRLKQELYRGEKIRKAVAITKRSTLGHFFDSNILMLLMCFMFFYFSLQSLRTFSIGTVFSVISLMFATILITRFASLIIVDTKTFINKPGLLGMRSKKLHPSYQAKLSDFDFIKSTKWVATSILIFCIVAIVVYAIFAGINGNWAQGFNLSLEFKGGTHVTIQGTETSPIGLIQAQQIKDAIINQSIIKNATNVISVNVIDTNGFYNVVIKTPELLTQTQFQQLKEITSSLNLNLDHLQYQVSPQQGLNFILNSLYAFLAAIVIVFVYVLIRYKWTHAISITLWMLLEFCLLVAFAIVARVEINELIVIGVASVLLYSTNDKLVLIAKTKELLANFYHNDYVEVEDIKKVANISLRQNLKRSIYSSMILVLIGVVLIAFIYPISFSFAYILIFGGIILALCSNYIYMYLWTKLEIKRHVGIKKRFYSKYWVLPGVDEQIFPGINDFVA